MKMNAKCANTCAAVLDLETEWTTISALRRHLYFYTVLILLTVLWASWRSPESPGMSKYGRTAVERMQEAKTLVASFE